MTRRPAAPARPSASAPRGDARGLLHSAPGRPVSEALTDSLAGREAILIVLADLHSPWRRLPQLLQAARDIAAAAEGAPCAVIVNGDLFERGNVAALRSGGALDWRFLAALTELAPTFVNLGNHETAIMDDLAEFVVAARAIGAEPFGSIRDRRGGGWFCPPARRVALGGLTLGLLGLAPEHPLLYRAGARATLDLPEPVACAAELMQTAFAAVDQPVLVSHAGVEPDRRILPMLPPGAVMIGGHDHLSLNMMVGGVPYLHAGSWGSTIGVIALGGGAPPAASVILVDDAAPQDPALATLGERLLATHLAPEDREVIARLPRGMDLADSALFAAEAVRAGVGADIALLGHTGFGASLAPGPLTRFDFDSWFRFDGDVHVAAIEGDALRRILTLANQHQDTPLDRRTGDFLYAPPFSPEPGQRYRVAVADWTAMHQRDYLGSDGHPFRQAPGFRIKPAVEAALRRLGAP